MNQLIFSILVYIWMSLQLSLNFEEGTRLRALLGQQLKNNDSAKALATYQTIQAGRFRVSPVMRLQVSNAALQQADTALARTICEFILKSNDPRLMRTAYNQLGVLQYQKKKYKQSLAAFRKSLEIDPSYKLAAYNYEVVSRRYATPPPQTQNKKQMEEQMQNSTLAEQTDQKQDLLDRTNPPQMGRERAMQLLDAMRSNEGQGFLFRPRFKQNHEGEKDW